MKACAWSREPATLLKILDVLHGLDATLNRCVDPDAAEDRDLLTRVALARIPHSTGKQEAAPILE